MLTYFIIIFVVALALAPLSHFLPSKRQRKVAGMREYAAVHGMFVEFRACLMSVESHCLPPFQAGRSSTMVVGSQTSELVR